VLEAFPDAVLDYRVDDRRQGIVDTWPQDVEDAAARADWGYAPQYDFRRAFDEYLIPQIRARYAPG
jgi:threonine 3-dehydrogenase